MYCIKLTYFERKFSLLSNDFKIKGDADNEENNYIINKCYYDICFNSM